MENLNVKKYDFKNAKEFFESKINFTISPFELNKLIKNNVSQINIIDVRLYEDYIDGHIPFAQHIMYDDIEEHFNMFDKDKFNIIYCYNQFCNLAHRAALKVIEKNYPTRVLLGGIKTWKKYDYETIKTSDEQFQ